jgi:hypothetical protein
MCGQAILWCNPAVGGAVGGVTRRLQWPQFIRYGVGAWDTTLGEEYLPLELVFCMTRRPARRQRVQSAKVPAREDSWYVSENPKASTIGQFGVVAGVIALCGTSGWLVRELKIEETFGLLAIPVAAGLFWVQIVVILRIAEFVKAKK